MGYLDKDGLSRAFTKLKTLIDKKADVGHTHLYAGSYSVGGTAIRAYGIAVSDTRNENSAPNDAAFDKKMLTADLKYSSKIGSPTGFNGTYCGVLSLAPWADNSGGHGYQLAFGYEKKGHPRLALRGSDLSTTSWDSWYKVYTSDDKPTLSELGAAAASHSHTKSQITDFAHTHDDRYYTETEMDSKLSGKANSSHTHTKSQITDFPSSMKNPNSLTISLNGTSQGAYDGSAAKSINVTPSSIGAATSGHTHNYAGSSSAGGNANWANGATYSQYTFSDKPTVTSGTGSAYTATVKGLTLVAGASFVMVPHVVSTTTVPTLNVNSLGAKNIRMRLSSNTSSTIQLIRSDFLVANKPVKVVYDGTYWVLDDFAQPDANYLYGTLISRGTSAPSNGTGGFIYIQTT